MWESLRGGARSTSQSQHQDGQPHGLAFGVQRNSHALHTLQLWQGGPTGWTSQTSDLRPQISDFEGSLAQRLSCRDVPPNKPRPCDGPCDGARVWGNTEAARCSAIRKL